MSTAIDISAVDLSHFFRTWITRIMYMTLNSPSWIVSVFAYRNDQYWSRVTYIIHITRSQEIKSTPHISSVPLYLHQMFSNPIRNSRSLFCFVLQSVMSVSFSPIFNRFNWGTWKGGPIRRTLKDEWRRALGVGHLSPRGPEGRAPLLGTPKDMLSKALEMGICFHRGPAFGEHGGTLLS
jgi:hypothetical protein